MCSPSIPIFFMGPRKLLENNSKEETLEGVGGGWRKIGKEGKGN